MEMQECTDKFLDVFLILFSPQIQECPPEVTSPSVDSTVRSSFGCLRKLFFLFLSFVQEFQVLVFYLFHPET